MHTIHWCMYVMYVYLYVCSTWHVWCMYVWMYVCNKYVCVHTCMYVCMHVCMYTYECICHVCVWIVYVCVHTKLYTWHTYVAVVVRAHYIHMTYNIQVVYMWHTYCTLRQGTMYTTITNYDVCTCSTCTCTMCRMYVNFMCVVRVHVWMYMYVCMYCMYECVHTYRYTVYVYRYECINVWMWSFMLHVTCY